jgi:hypothetical protein
MKTSLTERKSRRPADPSADADHRSILVLVGRLLVRMGRGDGVPPPGQGGQPPAWWDDEEYVYLEAALPQPPDCGADITIHDGRVFIRLEK